MATFDHKTIISEESCNKTVCDGDHKYKSELKIPIQYPLNKIQNIDSQIEQDYSVRLEKQQQQELVSTITVQNKQGSDLNKIKPKEEMSNGKQKNNMEDKPLNIFPKHKNLLLMKSYSQNSVLPAKSDQIRYPVLGTVVLNDKKLGNGTPKSDSAYFSQENIDAIESGKEKRNSVTFAEQDTVINNGEFKDHQKPEKKSNPIEDFMNDKTTEPQQHVHVGILSKRTSLPNNDVVDNIQINQNHKSIDKTTNLHQHSCTNIEQSTEQDKTIHLEENNVTKRQEIPLVDSAEKVINTEQQNIVTNKPRVSLDDSSTKTVDTQQQQEKEESKTKHLPLRLSSVESSMETVDTQQQPGKGKEENKTKHLPSRLCSVDSSTEPETVAQQNTSKEGSNNFETITNSTEPIKPSLRHVLTQTSVEFPSPSQAIQTPISRVGCAESGVLRPRSRAGTSSETAGTVVVASAVDNQGVRVMSSMEQENLREREYQKVLRDVNQMLVKEERYSRDGFQRIARSKEFLDLLFKLFDQDKDNLLQQESWIEFLKERLSDEKQVDFAEQVESVAYVLCGDGPVTPELFQQIFHAKGIVDKLFRLLDRDNTGTLTPQQVMEFVSTITNTRPRTGFDKKSLESLEQLFRQTVGNEKEIRREDFQKIVISKNPFFTERVFQIFDKDNSGSISLQEFLDAMHQFAGQSPDDKIKFLFKIYDIDGDGLIQHRELQHVLRACMEENGMQFSDSQLSELTSAMFEDADASLRGAITYEALKHQLEKHGGLLENLSISIDRWLVPPAPQRPAAMSLAGKLKALRPYQLTTPYIRNNYVYLAFLVAFIAVNVGLFVSRGVEYANKGENGFVIVARACGQCLNFNSMFILVLMLRQCITFLRTRGFSSILPLDHHIYLHKLVGMVVGALSLLHTIMHLANFSVIVVNHPEVNSANYTIAEWLLTSRPGKFGLIPGWANPTGMVLVVILTVMVICSQAFVRRGGCFEVFYWTHLLYIPFWLLLLLHGPNFWKWFILPGGVYLVERALRLAWMRSARGNTYISSGLLLPSRVTHLVIKRPLHFVFHPGDYVFVNIPAIAKYEWHPFTVSSAPEQEDYMWLHIRAVGEWTNRLYSYFEREQERLHNGEVSPMGSPAPPVPSPAVVTPSTPLQRLQATLQRRFSQRSPRDVQLVAYTPRPQHRTEEDGKEDRKKLEKSLSMPDIQTKAKKRERLLVLREYMRSESERSFDECQVRRARLQSLGLAYLSPQNKSLAQSFRYLRHKPTIIAFKTPSLENCERGASSSSLGSVGGVGSTGSYQGSPERQAEEGRVSTSPDSAISCQQPKPVNYPVGKPLEPIPEDRSMACLDELRETLVSVDGILGRGTEIYLDGPYGAPSSHIFRAQHAVLIATGIGVTPFASILQSIMHRYWKARHQCPGCGHCWSSSIPAAVMHLRKVDFFWINRDQRSFEWFVHLLSQLEMEQAELGAACERFLEMHMYITSALQRTDMKAVGLQLALDLLHEKEKRDLITGLKTRTNAGRPNWDKVFRQLQEQRKGKVTVFYCGPPQLARLLRVKCDQHGFHFRKETF